VSSPGAQPPVLGAYRPPPPGTTNLADVLERVLDKGMVIAGDITISLLDIELLTIKLRLLIASVDRARDMGIDWWERDSTLSGPPRLGGRSPDGLSEQSIEERIRRLEQASGISNGDGEHGDTDGR
jgi:gas vesicle protein GvpA/GvpJ/GvpM family